MKKLFGKRIKELRIKKGLTQEQLAEMLSMGERNLSKIECGISFTTMETLEKLTEIFEVSAKDLFDFDHLKDEEIQKEELIKAIKESKIETGLMYRIYQSLKK